MLCFTFISYAQYNLAWGEYEYLDLPDPPYNGYVAHATWNVNNTNITFDEADEVGAIIYPNHYFEGTSVVTCNYRYEYYRNGRYQTGTSMASYYITFKSQPMELNKTEISLNIGQTAKISAVFPNGYIESGYPKMTWESSNEDVATVVGVANPNNKTAANVKAISSGKTTITYDPVIGPPLTCVVNVAYIEPQSAQLTPNPLSVTVGKTKKLNISYTPEGASAKKVIWESANTNVATVSSSGLVKGIAEGETTITAITDNGVKAKVNVSVLPLPMSVSLPSKLSVFIGYSKTLIPTVQPSNSESSYKWKSSDTSVATISGGKVEGKKSGVTTITVTTENDKTASCEVTVQKVSLELNNRNATNRINVIESLVKRSIK